MRYKRVKLGLPFLVISSVVLSAVSCSAIDKLRIKRVRKNDGFVDISPPNSREEADAFIVNVLQKHYLNFSAENWNQMIDYVIDYDNFLKNDNWFLTKILINKNRKILKKLFQVVNYQGLNALNIEEFPIIKDVLNLNDYKLLLYFWNVFSKFPKKGVRASLKNNREFITKFFKNFGFKNNEILEVIKNILFFDQKRIFVVPSNLETKLSILFNKILESTLLGKSWNQLFNFFPSSWKGKERTEKTIKFLEYCFSYFFKLSSEKPNYLFSFNKKNNTKAIEIMEEFKRMNNTITAKETHKIYSKVWKNPKRREEYWKWEFNNSKKLKLKGFKIEYVNLLKTHNLKHEDILETMRVMANGKRSIEKWYKNKDLFIFAFAVAAWRNYNYLLKSKFSSREEWLSVLKENLIHKLDRWLASEKNYELLKSLIKDHIKDVDKGLKMFTYFVQINEKIFEEKVFDDPFNQDFVTLKKNLPQAIEDAINYEFAWKFYGNWFKYFIKMKNKHKFLKPKIQFEKLNKITPLKLKQNDFFKGRGLLEVNQLDLANLINSLWGLLANIDKVVHTFMKKNLPLQTKENIDFSQKSPTSIFLKQQNKWIKKIIWINPVIFSLIFHKLIHSAWDKWTPSEVHKIVTWLNSLVTSTSKKITYKDFQFLLNIWNKGLNIEKLEPKSYQNLINLGLQFRNKFLEN